MKRVPRLLVVAFALSLLLHLIVALVLRPAAPSTESQSEVVSIQHRPATIALKRPPPPPTPPPPRHTPAPRTAASAPPRTGPGFHGTQGASAATPPPAPVAAVTPRPAATATAGCAHADAAVVSTPAPPEIPVDARASGTSGTALVSVALDASGSVTKATVTQSTGNSSLDLVAVAMARDARYSPATLNCKPIAGAYVFSVKFVAW